MSLELSLAQGVTLLPTGVEIPQAFTFAQWQDMGVRLSGLSNATQWIIGDWLVFGEAKYGQRYEAAMKILPYDYQTLADFKYVASKVQFSSRNEKLSFKHHRVVAPLSFSEQRDWLEIAESEGLTADKLRERIQQAREEEKQVAARADRQIESQDDMPPVPTDDFGMVVGGKGWQPPRHESPQGPVGPTTQFPKTGPVEVAKREPSPAPTSLFPEPAKRKGELLPVPEPVVNTPSAPAKQAAPRIELKWSPPMWEAFHMITVDGIEQMMPFVIKERRTDVGETYDIYCHGRNLGTRANLTGARRFAEEHAAETEEFAKGGGKK